MALNPSVKAELCGSSHSCLYLTEAELRVASTLQVRVQILPAAKPRIFKGAVFDSSGHLSAATVKSLFIEK